MHRIAPAAPTLEARALGVGSTWVMGHPAEDAKPFPGHADKKPLDETVFRNRF